jgi:hypothetical protein
MKKRLFLAPLAVSVAALLGSSPTDAKASAAASGSPVLAAGINSQGLVSGGDLVIERSVGQGSAIAQHSSHMSHESHSSHSSHRSGF